MKVSAKEIVDDKQLISHIVLGSLSATAIALYKKRKDEGEGYLNIRVMVEDEEVDIEAFTTHWQSQIDRMIKDRAKELMEERFASIQDTVFEIQTVVTEALNKLNRDQDP